MNSKNFPVWSIVKGLEPPKTRKQPSKFNILLDMDVGDSFFTDIDTTSAKTVTQQHKYLSQRVCMFISSRGLSWKSSITRYLDTQFRITRMS